MLIDEEWIMTRHGMSADEWIRYGNRVKICEQMLSSLINDPIAQGAMTVHDTEPLMKAIRNICEFKSRAEDAMYKRGQKPTENPLHVFYGPCQEVSP